MLNSALRYGRWAPKKIESRKATTTLTLTEGDVACAACVTASAANVRLRLGALLRRRLHDGLFSSLSDAAR
jgi:hypothetical protein